MGKVRGHEPFVIEDFNGLWSRGDDETCPSNHLLLANNIQFIHSGIETRTAGKPYTTSQFAANLRQSVRVYNYTAQWGQSLIVMIQGGKFYHVISATEIYEILNVPEATDFAMTVIAGRAYISPFKTYVTESSVDGTTQVYALGIRGVPLYVYGTNTKPDPVVGVTQARPAAGSAPSNAGRAAFFGYSNQLDGKTTGGFHIFGVAFNGGKIGPEVTPTVDATADKQIQLVNIPKGPGGTTSRTIVMSHVVEPYSGQALVWYNAFTIPDNTTTSFIVNLADADLTTVYVEGVATAPAVGAMTVHNPNVEGYCDLGFHLFGVVYETDSGYLTAPGPEFFTGQTLVNATKTVRIENIPTSPNPIVKKRHIVATKWIPEYNGDQKGYQFFFVPKGTIENNTATTIDVNFYDSDLVADASHLIENFSTIPSGVNMCEFHGRLVVVGDASYPKDQNGNPDSTKPDNRSVAWLSAPGEPEAINQVDGLIITQLDGNPLTHCEVFRDNLYLFKLNRTYAIVDNQDEPSTWGPVETLDQAIGAPVHGIAEVLDSGGVNVDYLIIGDQSGLMLFNGTYARPELSWKIENLWLQFNKNSFHKLQVVNDSIRKKIWVLHPVALGIVLLADYGNGMNPKDIRWALWNFEGANITSLALLRTDLLIMSTWQPNDPLSGL